MMYPFEDPQHEAYTAIKSGANGGSMGPLQREAAERLELALRGRGYSHHKDDRAERLTLYFAASMLACLRDGRLTRRWAAQESKVYARRFEAEMRLGNHDIVERAAGRLGMDLDAGGNSVGLGTYLRHMARDDPEWRLVNQTVRDGRVYVRRRVMAQLISAAVFGSLAEKIEGISAWNITDEHPWISSWKCTTRQIPGSENTARKVLTPL